MIESVFSSIDDVMAKLSNVSYVTDRATATAVFLASSLQKPLLVEGPAGIGKTELAKAVATCDVRSLIRLQCYEGLDESKALYEWEYTKQMLYTQLLRDSLKESLHASQSIQDAMRVLHDVSAPFYSEHFLIERPLLKALRSETPTLLLIDEIDRSDPEFEAFLLEILSDFQVSIPELGTVRARHIPMVILTSNGTRELSDAVRRRCICHFMDYPPPSQELEILRKRVPEAEEALRAQIVLVAEKLRDLDLKKPPSIAEVVEWTRAIVLLGAQALDEDLLRDTLALLAKYPEDASQLAEIAPELL